MRYFLPWFWALGIMYFGGLIIMSIVPFFGIIWYWSVGLVHGSMMNWEFEIKNV